ncbi:MAG: hypothetical protein JXA67_05240 [Micromonosporaceae bacterium]|nr:hypothetical protein [Micromonosporaceae bacterium]
MIRAARRRALTARAATITTYHPGRVLADITAAIRRKEPMVKAVIADRLRDPQVTHKRTMSRIGIQP